MNSLRETRQRLSFSDVQPHEGRPLATVVLIHGAGGSRRNWRYQSEALSDRFRVIAVDLPGHGSSEGSGEATIVAYARYVVELVESLGLNNIILGGHSMGGAIALEIALKAPHMLGGLILVGTGARLRVLPAIFSLIREDFEVAVQGMVGFMFGSGAAQDLIDEQKQLMAENSPDVLLKDFTACDSFDIMDEVDSIKLPALIVCGKEDRLTPAKYSELLHEKIANSELVLFDNCGHMAMLEQSESLNRCVLSFLARI